MATGASESHAYQYVALVTQMRLVAAGYRVLWCFEGETWTLIYLKDANRAATVPHRTVIMLFFNFILFFIIISLEDIKRG